MGMIKNSKNREKQRIRVSKLHERVSNQGYQWMDIRQLLWSGLKTIICIDRTILE